MANVYEDDSGSVIWEGEDVGEDKDDEMEEVIAANGGQKKKGRKCSWDESLVDDLVDIILESTRFKEKLLLTNVKNKKNTDYYVQVINQIKDRCTDRNEIFPYSVNQTRSKFKRCVAICREAVLKIKTASGIKRFQEDKELGKWFSKLFPIITSMASCQPEQAIEPSDGRLNTDEFESASSSSPGASTSSPGASTSSPGASTSSTGASTSSPDASESSSKGQKRKLFVPMHNSTRKSKKATTEKLMEDMSNSLKDLKEILADDPTKDLIKFLKDDSERQSKRDDMFMGMMASLINGQYTQSNQQHKFDHSRGYERNVNSSNDTFSFSEFLNQP